MTRMLGIHEEVDSPSPFSCQFYLRDEAIENDSGRYFKIDLDECRGHISDELILNVFEAMRRDLIDAHISVESVFSYYSSLRRALKALAKNLRDENLNRLNARSLTLLSEEISKVDLRNIKYFWAHHRDKFFVEEVYESDFKSLQEEDRMGVMLEKILGNYLTPLELAQLQNSWTASYEAGMIAGPSTGRRSMSLTGMGRFAYLSMQSFLEIRPASARKMSVGDLRVLKVDGATRYFLSIPLVKGQQGKVEIELEERLGLLLTAYAIEVVSYLGQIFDLKESKKFALFPVAKARGKKGEFTGLDSDYAMENFGRHRDVAAFSNLYGTWYDESGEKHRFSATAARHSAGLYLASMGLSAKTIQAYLLHGSPDSCEAYVDIQNKNLIDQVSSALEQPMLFHLPVLKRINPDGSYEGRVSAITASSGLFATGECGKKIACERAPFSCYVCDKFTAFIEAPHRELLAEVRNNIEVLSQLGGGAGKALVTTMFIEKRISLIADYCDKLMGKAEAA